MKKIAVILTSIMLIVMNCLTPSFMVSAEEGAYYNLTPSTHTVAMGNLLPETMDSHKTFTITNNGNVPATVTWTEDNPSSAFIIELVSDGYLYPGQSATFEVWQTQLLPPGDYWASAAFYAFEDETDSTLAYVDMYMTIVAPEPEPEPEPIVTAVEIAPTGATVSAGSSYTFAANVYGQNLITDTVTWSISGNQSGSTSINSAGTLTVAANETASSISVKAASNQDLNVYNIVQVNITRPTFTVRTSSNPSEGGSVSGGGSVNYGGKVTLTAKPNSGYSFEGFYEGNSKISSASSLELNGITSDRSITANFVRSTYTVKAYVNPEKTGSISGAGTFNRGSKVELKATPANGYIFTGWTKEGKVMTTDETYKIGSLDSDLTLVANFAKKEATTYSIKASVNGDGGSITPGGEIKVTEGASAAFTVTPASGYKVSKVLIDGSNIGAVESYTFTGVKGAHSIVASFTKVEQKKTDTTTTNKSKTTTDTKKTENTESTDKKTQEEPVNKTETETNEVTEPEQTEPEEIQVPEENTGIMGKHNLNEVSLKAVIEDHDSAMTLVKEAYDEGYLRVSVSTNYENGGQPEVLNASQVAMESLSKEDTYSLLSGNAYAYNVSISDNTGSISQEAKSSFESKRGYKPVGYFDLSILKISLDSTEEVKSISTPLVVKVPIPASYQKDGRQFYVLRNHDGEVTVLENIGDEEGYVTFATDRFSDYALCYKDKGVGGPIYIAFIAAGIALITAIIFTIRKLV